MSLSYQSMAIHLPTPSILGGRLAAGIIRLYSEKLRFSGELGGGYYGNQSVQVTASGVNGSLNIDGYDLLVGALYKFNQFDVFGNVGVMIQNNLTKVTENAALAIPGGFFKGTTITTINYTQALPEIKVGGIYNLNDNWGISLAYMHVFGLTKDLDGSAAATTGSGVTRDGIVDLVNPTLDSIMLGLRLNIA